MSDPFPLGYASAFKHLSLESTINAMQNMEVFKPVPELYFDKIRANLQTFETRVDTALELDNVKTWQNLCNEPKSLLKGMWKVRTPRGTPSKNYVKSAEIREQEIAKYAMQSLYYCIYTIVLWRNDVAAKRYGQYIISFDQFQKGYDEDTRFPHERIAHENWYTLYCFRNVIILASAVKSSFRNKGLFVKVGSILAENRIHAMGGGQSFAADRRGYIYDCEGGVFAQPMPVVGIAEADNENTDGSTPRSTPSEAKPAKDVIKSGAASPVVASPAKKKKGLTTPIVISMGELFSPLNKPTDPRIMHEDTTGNNAACATDFQPQLADLLFDCSHDFDVDMILNSNTNSMMDAMFSSSSTEATAVAQFPSLRTASDGNNSVDFDNVFNQINNEGEIFPIASALNSINSLDSNNSVFDMPEI